jgi:hypothetical protein
MILGVRPEKILRPFMGLAFSMLKLMFSIATTAVKSLNIPLSSGSAPVSYSGQRKTQGAHQQGVDKEYGNNRWSGFKENTGN